MLLVRTHQFYEILLLFIFRYVLRVNRCWIITINNFILPEITEFHNRIHKCSASIFAFCETDKLYILGKSVRIHVITCLNLKSTVLGIAHSKMGYLLLLIKECVANCVCKIRWKFKSIKKFSIIPKHKNCPFRINSKILKIESRIGHPRTI